MTGALVLSAADSPAPSDGFAVPTGQVPTAAETTPTAAEMAAYNALDCTKDQKKVAGQEDHPTTFLITCGDPQTEPQVQYKYLLMPTLIQGKEISSASAVLPDQTGSTWVVDLNFNSSASARWANFTAKNIGKDTAIVLDGLVTSAEFIQSAIPGGNTQISGNFTQKTATELATALQTLTVQNFSTQSSAVAPAPTTATG